jgi:hypothetical protein
LLNINTVFLSYIIRGFLQQTENFAVDREFYRRPNQGKILLLKTISGGLIDPSLE